MLMGTPVFRPVTRAALTATAAGEGLPDACRERELRRQPGFALVAVQAADGELAGRLLRCHVEGFYAEQGIPHG